MPGAVRAAHRSARGERPSELQQFQGRVQRCVAQCQDRQRGQTDSAKYDKCISECAVFYQKELAQLKPKLMKKP